MGLLRFTILKKESIYFYAILLIIGTLPFSFKVNGFFVFLLAFYWLISGDWCEKVRLLKSNRFHLLMILFYFLHIFALFYTENLSAGLLEIEKKLPLLVLPLVLGSVPYFNQARTNQLIWFFVLTCFLTIIYSSLKIVYLHSQENQTDAITILREALPLHYPYFGMYLAFATLFVLHKFNNSISTSHYLVNIFFVITFSFFIIYIGAKMAFASLLLLCAVYLVTSGFVKRKYSIKSSIKYCLLFILSFVAILVIPQSRERFIDTFNQFELKLVSWKCGLNVLENSNLAIGAGPADVQDLLQLCYYNIQSWMINYSYNAHNQFIETAAGLGLIGLCVLLSLVYLPIYRELGLRKEPWNTMLILFIALFIFSSLTESILQANKGVIFFSLFYSILVKRTKNPYQPSNKS